MKTCCWPVTWRRLLVGALAALALGSGGTALAQPAVTNAVVIEVENNVEVLRAGSAVWDRASTNLPLFAGDQLRTGPRSRALVQRANLMVKRLGARSLFKVDEDRGGVVHFLRGAMYYFHRDKPGTMPVGLPGGARAVIRGTEFHLQVDENDTATLSLFDGEVDLESSAGTFKAQSGDEVILAPGLPPRIVRMSAPTAMLSATNLIQWALYYPGVLEVDELPLEDSERAALRASLEAYRAGDIRGALVAYPEDRFGKGRAAERLLQAALLLSVGQAQDARELLGAVLLSEAPASREARLAAALQRMVAAVQAPSVAPQIPPLEDTRVLSTEWLAESYVQQARLNLAAALQAAKRATEMAPASGFAWERVAELEFSFRRVPEARRALDRSLALAPRNAQAHALRGFLLAAENETAAARRAFEQAMALDGALANAWLGRGLCRIRQGEADAGRQDLQVAAMLEPQRGVLRSYLAKAWSQTGQDELATKEIRLAQTLDPADPTAWLYSALINMQQNRVNDAVRDFEQSKSLNNNRQVARSPLLLDEDLGVRRANLAAILREAGMTEVSVREAARGVSSDYASFSSHLFLAQSYDALRDPQQNDLRFESAFLSEYLIANLLSPTAVGTLSPQVSQQEYSRLFEGDGFGLASSTEYFSRGDWVQSAVQYGNHGNFSYSAEAAYRSENGEQPNGDFEQSAFTLRLKHQLSVRDSLYLQTTLYDAKGGDTTPYYDPDSAIRGLSTREEQEALVLAGYHREWSPGQHTLLLLGRAPAELRVRNPQYSTSLLDRSVDGSVTSVIPGDFHQAYESDLELYTAEWQQIVTHRGGTLVAGARYQAGTIDTDATLSRSRFPPEVPFSVPSSQDLESDFDRVSVYAYESWDVHASLQLIAGLSYDWLEYPRNFRSAPISSREDPMDRLSPKAGFIYTPLTNTVVRGAYTRGLGGASFDQSFRIEPSQVAGFNQAFRSIIPEAVAGATTAATFETAGLAIEQKFGTGTYLGLSGELLRSDLNRDVGVFEFTDGVYTAQTREELRYQEQSLLATFNQLLGEGWSLGASYRLSYAELENTYTGVPASAVTYAPFARHQNLDALLQQVRLLAIYNHSSGWFAQMDSVWLGQQNDGDQGAFSNESFWQHNLFVGYRFARRRAEIRVGVLNVTDEDYRLSPVNVTARLPRERTFYSGLQFNF